MLTLQKLKSQIKNGLRPRFHFFWGGPFSNWYMANFQVDCIIYNCTEQYMMAEKARTFNDKNILNKILKSKFPKEQKLLGRQVKNFNTKKWDTVKTDVMIKGNLAKFSQNKRLLTYLLATKNKILVEASPEDAIWGIKLHAKHPDRKDPNKWQGLNLLGFCLMEVRNILTSAKEQRKSAAQVDLPFCGDYINLRNLSKKWVVKAKAW